MAGHAIDFFHYLGPISVPICFAVISIQNLVTFKKPKPFNKKQRNLAFGIIPVIALAYIGESVLTILQTYRNPTRPSDQAHNVYNLFSVFFWVGVGIFSNKKEPIWYPYLGATICAACTEIALVVLYAVTLQAHRRSATTLLALSSFRALLLIGACANLGFLLRGGNKVEKGKDVERQPLLNGPTDTKAYGAVEETSATSTLNGDDDEDEDGKKAKKSREELIQEKGGWWAYARDYMMFLPSLWPAGKPPIQLCLLIMLVKELVFDRAINLLIARQWGILINCITADYGTGNFPIKEFAIWVFMLYLVSGAGVSLIEKYVEVFYDNFARKQLATITFNHVMRLSMDFHHDKDLGEIIAAIGQGDAITELLKVGLFEVFPIFIDIIIATVYITTQYGVYTTCIFYVCGAAYLAVGFTMSQYTVASQKKYSADYRTENKVQTEGFSNWETVSYFNTREHENQRYQHAVNDALQSWKGYSNRYRLIAALQNLIMQAGFAGVAAYGIYQVSMGVKDIGSFVTLISYWSVVVSPVSSMLRRYKELAREMVSAEKLIELMKRMPSILSREDAPDFVLKEGKVEYQNVDFAYDPRKKTLKDVSFEAKSGQTIAFVGETGGGKSTTVKLLMRFYDVTGGRILIDDQDIRDVKIESLREHLGIVPQAPSMFNTSVMENVRYSRLSATDEEVMEACKAAAIHDKILTFTDGYKTKVGERGVKLSGGELQRIAIARVLVKNPRIVILDEATSAVDSNTESHIQEALRKLTTGRTTFIIAHRLSTIMHADQILVITDGEVVERGNHWDLLRQGGKYKDLWTAQTTPLRSLPPSANDNGEGSSKASSMTAKDGADHAEDVNVNQLIVDVSTKAYSEALAQEMLNTDKDDAENEPASQIDGQKDSKVKTASKNIQMKIQQLTKANGKAAAVAEVTSQAELEEDGKGEGELKMVSPRPTGGFGVVGEEGKEGEDGKKDGKKE
ncbi:hypothetical protein K402DRAFT_337885 [Aulographum hederae CBS 113979]|uniref:Heavy metal tolerance protein n=1 Tax=Aulographum hederae CBS 113979 TaxID=1176131 RepID=A0A6G1GS67_9PEZI|nr:hypothetical protein K402DRAFT_337885 [Aulographum hederae CBS 113979]